MHFEYGMERLGMMRGGEESTPLSDAGAALSLIAFLLYVFADMAFRYSLCASTFPILAESNLLRVFEDVAMGLAIASLAIRRRTLAPWQIVLAVAAMAVLFYSATRSGNYRLAQGFLLILAISGIGLRKICRAYCLVVACVVIAVILLSLFGVIINRDIMPNARLVFSFGFAHPNSLGAILFSLVGAMSFVYWQTRKWVIPLVLSVSIAVFDYYCLSSHASAMITFLLAVALLIGHLPFLRGLDKLPKAVFLVALLVVPLLLMVVMLVCAAFYDGSNPVFLWLNNLTHGRPYFAHEYYLEYGGFTDFGRKYVVTGNYHNGLPFNGVDSGYCHIPLVYGLFALGVLVATYLVAIWKLSRKEQRFAILALMVICSLYLVVECYPLYITTSVFPLFLSEAFSNAGGSFHEEPA